MRAIARRLLLVLGMSMLMLAGLWEVSYGQQRGYTLPLTPADSALFVGRLTKYGPPTVDRLTYWTEHSTWVACPFYSATLKGRQLTKHLLGRQHEVAMELLGYSDTTPYELTVIVAKLEAGTRGRVYHDWRYSAPMTKAAFDSLYGSWISELPGKFPMLANPPYPQE